MEYPYEGFLIRPILAYIYGKDHPLWKSSEMARKILRGEDVIVRDHHGRPILSKPNLEDTILYTLGNYHDNMKLIVQVKNPFTVEYWYNTLDKNILRLEKKYFTILSTEFYRPHKLYLKLTNDLYMLGQ